MTNFLNFARPEQLTLAPIDLRAIVERAVADQSLEAGRVVIAGKSAVCWGMRYCCGRRSAT